MITRRNRGLAAALLAGGCLLAIACGAPEDAVEGRIESDTPLASPLSATPVCAAQLRGDRRLRSNTGPSSTSPFSGPWRYASGARLVVDGRAYAIEGDDGSPMPEEQGERWGGATAPAALAEYGSEGASIVRCYGPVPPERACMYRYEAYEHFVRCGADVRLRGEIQGDRFVLHRREASAAGLGILGGFGLCILCPVLALIAGVGGLIVVFARRKKAG